MSKEYPTSSRNSLQIRANRLFLNIQHLLMQHSRTLSDFGLPQVDEEFVSNISHSKIIADELSVNIPDEDIATIDKLNAEQSTDKQSEVPKFTFSRKRSREIDEFTERPFKRLFMVFSVGFDGNEMSERWVMPWASERGTVPWASEVMGFQFVFSNFLLECLPVTFSFFPFFLYSFLPCAEYTSDDLPLWGFVGELHPDKNSDNKKHLLYTHKIINVKYNGDQIIPVNLIQDSPKSLEVGKILEMTYSVRWMSTNITFARHFDVYLDYPFFEHQVNVG
ncbi:hypothetical protein HHK36_006386 [Tetracentron sinense]|uniref:Transmembrane 9 superfamily member n=1 Tax=Tetracentron sinense TaxID=13715 RepID=A0A834ZHE2_TETSI|nr:hypothetical protein HHK36_006386 [Tetracentron sinense]